MQLHLNQNELEWRKTVTAATAALKMPHLLETNHRSYTHASLDLDIPTRFLTPTKLNTSRASAPPQATKPSWWVAADKAKGDTHMKKSLKAYTHMTRDVVTVGPCSTQ